MKKIKKLSVTVDQFDFDIDYDINHDCETHGCDYICRCSTISNIKILSLNDPISVKNYPTSVMNDYCIGRLLSIHGSYNIDNYEVTTCSGYYGEEISGVCFAHMGDLTSDINAVLSLPNDLEKLKYVLLKEYSYLPDYFDGVATLLVESVNLSDIVLNGLQKRDITQMVVDPTTPVGVLRRIDSTKYSIVDGYSRYAVLRGANVVRATYFIIV